MQKRSALLHGISFVCVTHRERICSLAYSFELIISFFFLQLGLVIESDGKTGIWLALAGNSRRNIGLLESQRVWPS